MYRVYDLKEKKFKDVHIYLSPNPYSDLYVLKWGLFGRKKFVLASPERYIYHRDIGLCDKDDVLIYEGDIVEAQVNEDRIVTGLITYAHELASYIILCYDSNEYFTLSNEVCSYVKVIGNVIENKELLPIDYIERIII